MKKYFLVLSYAAFTSVFNAQDNAKIPYLLKNTFIDATASFTSKQFSGALAWQKMHGIGKNQNFKIGYGIRFSTYFATDQNYLTAPAKITGASGFDATKDYDTVVFKKAQSNSINLALYFQYTFFKKLDIGFNIDAVGLSFGGNQMGDYSTIKYAPNPNVVRFTTTSDAQPTAFNALLVGDNDLGMLSSELMARYWLSNKLAVKVGLNYLFTEYTTEKSLRGGTNDRYRNKSAMFMFGITYKIK